MRWRNKRILLFFALVWALCIVYYLYKSENGEVGTLGCLLAPILTGRIPGFGVGCPFSGQAGKLHSYRAHPVLVGGLSRVTLNHGRFLRYLWYQWPSGSHTLPAGCLALVM